jgi:membrane associated rhomboid family serine protease
VTGPSAEDLFKAPVTLMMTACAVAVFGADLMDMDTTALELTTQAFWQEPWRLLTPALKHGDLMHLGFNLYWLWIFGVRLEKELGHFTTLGLMAFFELGSGAAEYAVLIGGIGLSGVGYGMFALVWVLDRYDARFHGAMPERVARLFVIWFFLCIAFTVTEVYPVANIAHGVGALLGGLAGVVLVEQKRASRGITKAHRIAAAVGSLLLVAFTVAASSVWRGYTNLSPDGGYEDAVLGSKAYDEDRLLDAMKHYERAVAISPTRAGSWYNLGLTYWRLEKFEAALNAYERASALSPSDSKFSDTVESARVFFTTDEAESHLP